MFKFIHRRSAAGFTLLEALIYAALTTILLTATITLFLSFSRTFADYRLGRALNHSARITLESFAREVRRAASVDLGQSTFASHPGRLVLNDALGHTQADFTWQDGTIFLATDGGAMASTTAARVTATNVVYHYLSSNASTAVRLELTLTANQGDLIKSENYSATAVLRGAY